MAGAGAPGERIARALEPALQQRRLFLAAVAVVVSAGRGNGGRASAAATAAGGLTALRANSVLGLADFPVADGRERLRQQLAALQDRPGAKKLAEPARFAELCSASERLAAAWFEAGVRLLSAPEICDERACIKPLEDQTPSALWVTGAAVTEGFGDDEAVRAFWARRRVALLHSRKGRELHSELPWVQATQAAARAVAESAGAVGAAGAAGPAGAAHIGGCVELPARLARAAAVAQGLPVVDVLTEP
ncbi:MAG TPA: hypothetical protein VL860_00180, partial [Planctomycetota bacterium]|nr:hypothetical protein [Planctomycetota bacterium]